MDKVEKIFFEHIIKDFEEIFYIPTEEITYNKTTKFKPLENAFVFYIPSFGLLDEYEQYKIHLNLFKDVFTDSKTPFYFIFKTYNNRAYYIFPFIEGQLDTKNILKISQTDLNLNRLKYNVEFFHLNINFRTNENEFFSINNKNQDKIKQDFFSKVVFNKNIKNYDVITEKELIYGYTLYGIIDKYGGINDKFLKDFQNLKTKINSLFDEYGTFSILKHEIVKIYNLNLNIAYTLLTKTNSLFLFLRRDQFFERDLELYIKSDIYFNLYELTKGKTLEEMTAKYTLYNFLYENLSHRLTEEEKNQITEIYKNVIERYKSLKGDNYEPASFKPFLDKIVKLMKDENINVNNFLQKFEKVIVEEKRDILFKRNMLTL